MDQNAVDASRMLPASGSQNGGSKGKAVSDSDKDAAVAPAWQRYGRLALFAGAAGAVAASGAAAYMGKEKLSSGWSWVGSHLEFVSSLARPEDMRNRLNNIIRVSTAHGIGFLNIYTTLGHAIDVQQRQKSVIGRVEGRDRTFVNVPRDQSSSGLRRFFVESTNDRAEDETGAHMSMFEPRNHPGYYGMSERAKEVIVGWVTNEWYEESEGPGFGFGTGLEEEAEMVEKEEVEEEFEDVKKPDVS